MSEALRIDRFGAHRRYYISYENGLHLFLICVLTSPSPCYKPSLSHFGAVGKLQSLDLLFTRLWPLLGSTPHPMGAMRAKAVHKPCISRACRR